MPQADETPLGKEERTGMRFVSLGGKPIEAWNGFDRDGKRRKDPATCHCGKPALYRHPSKHHVGYCKDHHQEAVKVTTGSKHRSER
jgi:hypothetical protein